MATAHGPPTTGQFRWRLLCAACLCLLSGCYGVTHNPSYFPDCFAPFGDIVRTHAKPGGFAYWKNFDPHAVRLEVRPCESTNPVQTQHVLIATVYDEKGQPRRNRRVEWMIEGVGNIIEVDESGFFPGRGYKVNNQYAVSYTDYCEHTVTRGNPADDFTIRPGQTYCVISSSIEGDTHVTAYAPEIYDWDCHKVFITKHWVDAEWRLPPPAINRVGTEHVFTTQISRHTDHAPLAGYRVRYRILDGPPAVFLPGRGQEEIVTSDLNGNASVLLAQLEPRPGVNRIGIEIIRAPDPTLTSSAGIIIGRGETRKEWQGPQVSMKKTVPPAVALGQEVPFTITISNSGVIESQEMTVRDAIPDGLQYLHSEPPATVEGNQLIWTLSGLKGGQVHTLQAAFRASKPGPITNTASLVTRDGLRDEQQATTQITVPQLGVKETGPATGILGVPVTFQITVTNPGNGPATNVLLVDDFDKGLQHDTHANPIKLPIGNLGPGETKTVPLTLTPAQAGRLVSRVIATADNELSAKDECPLVVQKAQLKIVQSGPEKKYLDRPATWKITVTNTGESALGNLVVKDQLPPELTFVSADQSGTLVNGEVVWNLGALQAGEQKTVQVQSKCAKMTRQALNVAVATADPGLQVQAEAGVEIMGLPAFQLEVQDLNDPIEVGGKTSYVIDVGNQGSLPGNQVQVTAYVPKEMRITNATGPTTPKIDGNTVTYPPLDGLPPKQKMRYIIEVQGLEAGDVRFRAELRAATLSKEVVEEEPTNIIAPPVSPRPRASAPPSTPAAPSPPASVPAAPPTGPGAPLLGRPQ